MISSSQYSPNIPHTSRVSPVMESEEEEYDDSDDYSPSDNNANGEAYLVTDFYHHPMPLVPPSGLGSRASDSGPEYSTPFMHSHTHSPGSMRHVFTPANSSSATASSAGGFQTGTKQKPRMGIMATRSLSEKGSKPADVRNYHLDLPHSQVSNDDLDSPVYDSTQYIVTPTRRRNSENDKSPNGRNYVRRDGGGVEYPEVRGRLGEGEEMLVVPPGVVLLQPSMFKDGTLDSRIMSEIEMTNLRVACMPPSPDTETSGDSSNVQDRLLAGHAATNGKGLPPGQHHYHHNNHQQLYNTHKHSPYDLGAPRPRPMTGSGVVFRRKRKPCWCVLLVVVAVAMIAAGISLGVLFGVVKRAESQEAAPTIIGDGAGRLGNATQTPVPVSPHNLDPGKWDEGGGGVQPVTDTTTTESSSTSTASTDNPSTARAAAETGGGSWGVSVRRFKAYWHPGDSRVMEVLLSNGTVLQAAGHKGNDGTFRGLYSLSLTDGQGRTTRVRFMGGRSLASVILPHGTVVSLDWSANNADIECKVFQIPPPRGAPGGGPGGGGGGAAGSGSHLHSPTSHLAVLQLGVHSFLLRQISRTLTEASATPGAFEEETLDVDTPKFCAPRLPVKVTKCGGQYPYDGAFVQGEVTLRTGPSLAMAALPWLRQDDDDECYREFQASSPNFFIPLPGHVERDAARVMAGRFWRTAARWWGRVCDVVGTVLEVDLERHKVCANMAASAQTQLTHSGLYTVVYQSCSALLTSLHLACRTLDDLTTRAAIAAANVRGGGGGSGGSGEGNSASAGPRSGSRQPLTQDLLVRVLANATSLQEPATSPQHEVMVKTYAFCPSTQPLTSFEKSLTLQSSAGGVLSRDISADDMVHVNCPGHPEVTYFFLGHAAAIEPLDMVKHRLKVCAVCAFEKTFSVHVLRDHMCCNDTCMRESRCEDSISEARMGPGLSESHTFTEQNSVYCHEFLTAADTPQRAPLTRTCLGTCQSNLEVRFQVRDAEVDEGGGSALAPVGGGRVYLDQVLTCLEGYLSTCKSTFGH